MRIIITESQMESMVKKYLDSHYKKIIKKSKTEYGNVKSSSYYFIEKNEDKNKSSIKFDSWSGRLFMTYELVSEIMSLFSIEDEIDAELIISEWVEEKLNVDIDVTQHYTYGADSLLGDYFKFD